jgi:transposase-like protein
MINPPLKKLILTREYKESEMYTCPYCGSVATPLDYEERGPWCNTGYKCHVCYEDVLPHRIMKK